MNGRCRDPERASRFAVTGVGGFVAPRHLAAIQAVGGKVVAALDPHDAVGFLDAIDPGIAFFTDTDRFVRHLEQEPCDYLVVCSPNHLHDVHCRLGLGLGADVICEKPVVTTAVSIDALAELERVTGHHVYTVLQLRSHPELAALRERLRSNGRRREVELTYLTARGRWYDASWKGDQERSGGLAMNIGVHMFDLLLWLFGPLRSVRVELREARRMAGVVELEGARVRFFLSVDAVDLAPGVRVQRSLRVDGETVDFSEGAASLHQRVYEEILAGRGIDLAEARPSVELASLVHRIAVHAAASVARDVQANA